MGIAQRNTARLDRLCVSVGIKNPPEVRCLVPLAHAFTERGASVHLTAWGTTTETTFPRTKGRYDRA